MRSSFDANGFSWTITDGSAYVASYPNHNASLRQEYYGDQNALFAAWASLYAQYRVNSITV
jgi:hypothetical protein